MGSPEPAGTRPGIHKMLPPWPERLTQEPVPAAPLPWLIPVQKRFFLAFCQENILDIYVLDSGFGQ